MDAQRVAEKVQRVTPKAERVTVVTPDGLILVDGLGFRLGDRFAAPEGVSRGIRALQWKGEAGHLEFLDGRPNRKLTAEDFAREVAPWVALWEAEKARLDELANRPPTPEEEAAARKREIEATLKRIDEQSARASRAVALAVSTGQTPDAADVQRLLELETQAGKLREELRGSGEKSLAS